MSLLTYYLEYGRYVARLRRPVAVVRTRPRAIPLAIITMRKSTHGFLVLSYMSMGLRYEKIPYITYWTSESVCYLIKCQEKKNNVPQMYLSCTAKRIEISIGKHARMSKLILAALLIHVLFNNLFYCWYLILDMTFKLCLFLFKIFFRIAIFA